MTNLLPLTEALLAWQLAGYAFSSCPALGEDPQTPTAPAQGVSNRAWSLRLASRSGAAALLLAAACQGASAGLWLAAFVLCGSFLLPIARRSLIPLPRLAEFEILANAVAALALWLISQSCGEAAAPVWLPTLNAGRLSALCASGAIFIYAVRGGGLIVRGILEKAGGLPSFAQPASASGTAQSYRHGEAIGQIERIVVILIVVAGTLQALAFFFAAKGLIRSKELEDRTVADYFLLGSLSSFLVALVAGLAVQNLFSALWK